MDKETAELLVSLLPSNDQIEKQLKDSFFNYCNDNYVQNFIFHFYKEQEGEEPPLYKAMGLMYGIKDEPAKSPEEMQILKLLNPNIYSVVENMGASEEDLKDYFETLKKHIVNSIDDEGKQKTTVFSFSKLKKEFFVSKNGGESYEPCKLVEMIDVRGFLEFFVSKL